MRLVSRGCEAYGYPVEGGFLVKKGSKISPDVTDGFRAQTVMFAKRVYLLAENIIDEDTFTRDYTFRTAATAATIISGMHGRANMWKEE